MYFTLHSNLEASFSDTEPAGILWKYPIVLHPSKSIFTICSCIPKIPYVWKQPPHLYHIPVLKSNLQKAVRRGHVEAAVATAWQWIRQGRDAHSDLLRRLPIILLEDAFLNVTVLTRIVWWMMAIARGWCFSECEYRQLLMDVAWMANPDCTPWREVLGSSDAAYTLEGFRGCEGRKRDALLAIWIRSCWGGMTGDMAFLRALLDTWRQREEAGWSIALQDPATDNLLLLKPLDDLTFSVPIHGLPEAIDYHCCSHMLFEIAKYIREPKHVIQDAIWWHRSGLNVRTFYGHSPTEPPTPPPFFRKIHFEPFVRKAWTPIQEPVTQQQSILRFILPAVPPPPGVRTHQDASWNTFH